PKRLPRPLAVDDCGTLIERQTAPSRGGPRYDQGEKRDLALVELRYGAGLRVSELSQLDVRDLDPQSGDVRVLGKGGVERVVPLPSAAGDAPAPYLGAPA